VAVEVLVAKALLQTTNKLELVMSLAVVAAAEQLQAVEQVDLAEDTVEFLVQTLETVMDNQALASMAVAVVEVAEELPTRRVDLLVEETEEMVQQDTFLFTREHRHDCKTI
jgi:hypothetical protein